MNESALIIMNITVISSLLCVVTSMAIETLKIRKVSKKLDEMREKRYSEDTPLKTGNL